MYIQRLNNSVVKYQVIKYSDLVSGCDRYRRRGSASRGGPRGWAGPPGRIAINPRRRAEHLQARGHRHQVGHRQAERKSRY